MKIKSQVLTALVITSIGSAIVLSLIFFIKPYWNNKTNNNTTENSENRLESKNEIDNENTIKTEEIYKNLVNADEYTNKAKLAESDRYIVWIVNFVGGDGNFDGEYLITIKTISSPQDSLKIDGTYNIFGIAEIAWENDNYIAVTNGTDICRGGEVISLENQAVVTSFSKGGTVVDYEGYLYFEDCHVEKNRPWAGPASSVAKMELATGITEVLFQADELTQYSIEKIEAGKIFITKTSVMIERDWNDENKYINEDVIFEL